MLLPSTRMSRAGARAAENGACLLPFNPALSRLRQIKRLAEQKDAFTPSGRRVEGVLVQTETAGELA